MYPRQPDSMKIVKLAVIWFFVAATDICNSANCCLIAAAADMLRSRGVSAVSRSRDDAVDMQHSSGHVMMLLKTKTNYPSGAHYLYMVEDISF